MKTINSIILLCQMLLPNMWWKHFELSVLYWFLELEKKDHGPELFKSQWQSSLHLLLINLVYNVEKTWWMFSTCCFLTGQVPSHKLFGSFSKYVSPVSFSPSVCCPENHQVNMSFKRNADFCLRPMEKDSITVPF